MKTTPFARLAFRTFVALHAVLNNLSYFRVGKNDSLNTFGKENHSPYLLLLLVVRPKQV